jgi:chromosome segregation protein
VQVLRLRLNGFKSFVDPTDLVIAPGLTGVVGPNGCGKSNLLEALRWVMGENRPTAMRGAGMEDVIFAGAASRPARAHAEVLVTLDNSERLAPQGFNDSDQLEIARRITRDAGSAYRVNGREARARDVQMLFADASTGAHSPALVRQGQIAELIAAKPRFRRRVLEEAAGISGLYQRRHEAELKLNGAEANLTRVDDVLDGLAQQLAQLARQAKQAARYRDIAANLRTAEALLLYRRWVEAAATFAARERALRDALVTAAQTEAEAGRTSRARAEADAAMPPLRQAAAQAAAALGRLDAEADRLADQAARAEAAIEAGTARCARVARDRMREAALAGDAETALTKLADERAALAAADAGADAEQARLAAAATLAAERLAAEEARLDRLTEEVGRLQARHESVARALKDAETALARAEDMVGAAVAERTRHQAAARDARAAMTAAQRAAAEQGTTADAATRTETEAQTALSGAREAEAAARSTRSAAEATRAALASELAALERLMAPTGDARPLIDDIEVEPGFEPALAAALGDDLTDPDAEWAALAPGDAPALPPGAEPMAPHVTRPGPLTRRLAFTGIVAADQGAALQAGLAPGQRLVSRTGDLWRWDGFARPTGAGRAAADRLERANRLTALRAELTQAQATETAAIADHAAAARALDAAAARARATREARATADAARSQAAQALSRADAAASRADSQLMATTDALARAETERDAASVRVAQAKAAVEGLEDPAAARQAMEEQRGKAGASRAEMLARRAEADEASRTHAARAHRLVEIDREMQGWRDRAATAAARLSELAEEAQIADAELAAARDLPRDLADRAQVLAETRDGAETERRNAADALAVAEARLRETSEAERTAERAASEAREARARAEATRDAAAETLGSTAARIREATGQEPETLAAHLGDAVQDQTAADALDARIAQLKRQRDALGAVNLRAEEDAKDLRVEHDTLAEEKRDLEAAIAKLRDGISGLNREGRARLLTAFDTVNAHFTALFSHLFGGGTARLVLVESDDPLEAGLEIMAQPPGKKLATLSLLSGGEQTLTAMALIFAVFLANPAPICVLDEVDAPLDDANVARFCDLLDEMTRRTETRFLIITHNAISMARMDRLFGVTMAEQGVSQLVSVDLRRAEALVA